MENYLLYIFSDLKSHYFEKNHDFKLFNEENKGISILAYNKDSIAEFKKIYNENETPDLIILYFSHKKYKSIANSLESLIKGSNIRIINHNTKQNHKSLFHHIKKEISSMEYNK